ncbi:MAG: hypothetical protein ABSH22_15905 [Tepidisphaeraceae bacterium]|jgi:hypothetical protein
MAGIATVLQVNNLAPRQASAVKRKAERLGLSVEDYIKQLIEDDLALDNKAQSTSLDELAKPFRKALKGIGDDELDGIVSRARPKAPPRR